MFIKRTYIPCWSVEIRSCKEVERENVNSYVEMEIARATNILTVKLMAVTGKPQWEGKWDRVSERVNGRMFFLCGEKILWQKYLSAYKSFSTLWNVRFRCSERCGRDTSSSSLSCNFTRNIYFTLVTSDCQFCCCGHHQITCIQNTHRTLYTASTGHL